MNPNQSIMPPMFNPYNSMDPLFMGMGGGMSMNPGKIYIYIK